MERGARRTHLLLAAIVAAYVALAALYAFHTPLWQAPDEPAHYNYVRALAEGEGLPVLEYGDYDDAYIRQLTTSGFAPELSIEPLEYEDHQPPSYYLLAVPVYLLFDGAVVSVRLLSVLLGAATLVAAFGTVRAIFPSRPGLALFVSGLIAFIPQHMALTAAVNNDALAELVVACSLWAAVLYLRKQPARPWLLGLLVGAALLAKTTAYITVGVSFGAVLLRRRQETQTARWALRQLAWILVPALLVAGPWLVRNALTYGWLDPLGLARHAGVAAGQMTTSQYITDHGWGCLITTFFTWTFNSFWGQFGWMAVLMPTWAYQALALFSGVSVAVFVWWLVDKKRARLDVQQLSALSLLLASALFTVIGYLWHNISYVQHQGRYLFPALIPLATAGGLGLRHLANRLPRRLRTLAAIGVVAGLAGLSLFSLFRLIVPELSV